MHFGKVLQRIIDENPSMNESLFLRYKRLKKGLKRIAAQLAAQEEGGDGAGAAKDGEAAGAGSHSATKDSNEAITLEEKEFMSVLGQDVHRFNQFFMEKEEDMVIRLQSLKDALQALDANSEHHSGASHGASGATTRHSPARAKLVSELVDFHGEVVQLLNWSVLNWAALQKILKKHDKITGHHIRDRLSASMLSQPFQSTEVLSQLVRSAEAEVQRYIQVGGGSSVPSQSPSGVHGPSGAVAADAPAGAPGAGNRDGCSSDSDDGGDATVETDLRGMVDSLDPEHAEMVRRTLAALDTWKVLREMAKTPSTVAAVPPQAAALVANATRGGEQHALNSPDHSAGPAVKRPRVQQSS
ncbi:unnamed protein product [Pedinophyceae sp. YPF-701]|nr:unnamed protein product [Pedinophyceae sp. YPF-701]